MCWTFPIPENFYSFCFFFARQVKRKRERHRKKIMKYDYCYERRVLFESVGISLWDTLVQALPGVRILHTLNQIQIFFK